MRVEGCCARDCTAFYGTFLAADAIVTIRGIAIHEAAPLAYAASTHHHDGCLWIGAAKAIDADGLNVTNTALDEEGLVAFISHSDSAPNKFIRLNARSLEKGWDVIAACGNSPVLVEMSNFVMIAQSDGIIYIEVARNSATVRDVIFRECANNHWFDMESEGAFVLNTCLFDGEEPQPSGPGGQGSAEFQFWIQHVNHYNCRWAQPNPETQVVSFPYASCVATSPPPTRTPSASPSQSVPPETHDVGVPTRSAPATSTERPTASYVVDWTVVTDDSILSNGELRVPSIVSEAKSYVVGDGVSNVVISAETGGQATFANLRISSGSDDHVSVRANVLVTGQLELMGAVDVTNVQLTAESDLYLVQDPNTARFPRLSVSSVMVRPRAGSVHVVMTLAVDEEQVLLTGFNAAATCDDWLNAAGGPSAEFHTSFALQCKANSLVLYDKFSGNEDVSKPGSNKTGIIVGVVVGVVVVLAVVIVVIVVLRKKAAEGEYAGMGEGAEVEGYEGEEEAQGEDEEAAGGAKAEAFESD